MGRTARHHRVPLVEECVRYCNPLIFHKSGNGISRTSTSRKQRRRLKAANTATADSVKGPAADEQPLGRLQQGFMLHAALPLPHYSILFHRCPYSAVVCLCAA